LSGSFSLLLFFSSSLLLCVLCVEIFLLT